jgi:hypothetical protein
VESHRTGGIRRRRSRRVGIRSTPRLLGELFGDATRINHSSHTRGTPNRSLSYSTTHCPAIAYGSEQKPLRPEAAAAEETLARRLFLRYFAGARIADQLALVFIIALALVALEVKQAVERSRDLVEGSALRNRFRRFLIDPAKTEVVIDEAEDGALVRHCVIDEVLLRKGRDYKQRPLLGTEMPMIALPANQRPQ